MTINYNFYGEFFDYEVEYEELEKAIKFLSEEYDSGISNMDYFEVKYKYNEELKDYFEEKAYKEYLDRRYA